jgi:hypothetical protein
MNPFFLTRMVVAGLMIRGVESQPLTLTSHNAGDAQLWRSGIEIAGGFTESQFAEVDKFHFISSPVLLFRIACQP